MSLSEQMIEVIEGSRTNDYQQRSAIGMARGWLDTGELALGVNTLDLKPNRDKLAADIVGLMGEFEHEECVEALQAARKHVNAPYQREAKGGAELLKPGAAKKAREK